MNTFALSCWIVTLALPGMQPPPEPANDLARRGATAFYRLDWDRSSLEIDREMLRVIMTDARSAVVHEVLGRSDAGHLVTVSVGWNGPLNPSLPEMGVVLELWVEVADELPPVADEIMGALVRRCGAALEKMYEVSRKSIAQRMEQIEDELRALGEEYDGAIQREKQLVERAGTHDLRQDRILRDNERLENLQSKLTLERQAHSARRSVLLREVAKLGAPSGDDSAARENAVSVLEEKAGRLATELEALKERSGFDVSRAQIEQKEQELAEARAQCILARQQSNPLLTELEQLVEIRQRYCDRVKAMIKEKTAIPREMDGAQESLIKARIELLREKAGTHDRDRALRMSELNQELANCQIKLEENEAQLRQIATDLKQLNDRLAAAREHERTVAITLPLVTERLQQLTRTRDECRFRLRRMQSPTLEMLSSNPSEAVRK